MTVKPDDDREVMKLSMTTKLKLAPHTPLETKLVLDYDNINKRAVASEWGAQMKGQMNLNEALPDNIAHIKTKSN